MPLSPFYPCPLSARGARNIVRPEASLAFDAALVNLRASFEQFLVSPHASHACAASILVWNACEMRGCVG